MVVVAERLEANFYEARQSQLSLCIDDIRRLQKIGRDNSLNQSGLQKSLHHIVQAAARARIAHRKSNQARMRFFMEKALHNVRLAIRQCSRAKSADHRDILEIIRDELLEIEESLKQPPRVML